MTNIFLKTVYAHQGEEHETTADATSHYFEFLLDPYIATALLFVALVITYFVLSKMKLKFATIVLSLLILDFVIAIAGLIFVPMMGIIALTLGIAVSIIFMLIGVSS